MSVSAADLSTLSRLLDEAIDLAAAQVEGWLAALPAEHAHLLPTLREMLTEHRLQARAAFLESGPRLADPAADESVAHAGDEVGPYRLIRELGRGGMGAVWLAERADGSLKRQIALKLPRLAWGAGLAARMARERDIGSLLEHPNIGRLYDAGVDATGRPYLALEYIDGQPLDAWCEARALGVPERLRLFLQVARAVAYAHSRLVVHRDLKPSNVLVTADGQTHLLDFGIAKLLHEAASGDERLTQEQGRVLTPHYASPEQLRGEAITVGSDVYSLGVLLYELLAGRPPFTPERPSPAALEEAILQGEPALASSRAQDKATAKALRGELDAILAKALRREPAQRYATADALAEDVERHLHGERVLAQPDSVGYRMRKTLRRHRVGFAAGGVILLAVIAAAGVSIVQAERANDAAERARVVKEFVIDVFKLNAADTTASAELRKLPAELLLEHGARLIETRFSGQPAMQAELYGVIAGIFIDMAAPERAVEFATRQVATLAAINAGRAQQADAMLLLARAYYDQDRQPEAELRIRRALALSAPDDEQVLRARILLAQVLWKLGRTAESEHELAHVESRLRGRAGGASIVRANALTLRADHLQLAARFDDAVPLLNAAIDEALAVEGPLSRTAIDARLSLAGRLVARSRFDESRAPRQAALAALHALGGANEIRAALEESFQARQMLMMGNIGFEEAHKTIEGLRSVASAGDRPYPETVRAWLDLALGSSYYIWGDIDRADRLIGPAVATLRPSAASPQALWRLLTWQGSVAMDAGRHDQADALLRERLQARKRMGHGQINFAAFDYIYIAMNLGMAGRFDEALAFLSTVPPIALEGGAAGSAYAQVLISSRARLRLDSGDAAAALALLPPGDGETSKQFLMVDDDRLVRGEALCALGQSAPGLALLQATVADYGGRSYAHHPRVARARAMAGLCALAGGQRTLAWQLARQAHQAFAAQPGVSPYFKAPSERLDRLLGARWAG